MSLEITSERLSPPREVGSCSRVEGRLRTFTLDVGDDAVDSKSKGPNCSRARVRLRAATSVIAPGLCRVMVLRLSKRTHDDTIAHRGGAELFQSRIELQAE